MSTQQRHEPWLQVKNETSNDRELTQASATREALSQAMLADKRVFVMGQGVDDPGGMFGCTKDLHKEFGKDRSFDTPLAETALMGVAVGAALGDMRPVYFHNRPDFLFLSADQLINHAAKWRYMFGGRQNVPSVVWACIGRGWASAAQHSQAPLAFFAQVPGLKVVTPTTPLDAKGLMLSAIEDPDPVVIFEHRLNFKKKCHVPSEMYKIPIGKAVIRRTGSDVSLIASSYMVHECLAAAVELEKRGVSAEVVDMLSLRPLDTESIVGSVNKTCRAVVADCGWLTYGISAEVAALISEQCFYKLRFPVVRIACPDSPTPAADVLERAFYPGAEQIVAAVERMTT
jgi:pyruvate dehydrogenase E1 component beta subunit